MNQKTIEPTIGCMKSQRYLTEIFLIVRFGLVGSLATVIHMAILWILLSMTMMPVLIANTMAFLTAFGFSFAGNYLWTFGAPGSPRRALLRFLTVSASAFFLNSVLLVAILESEWVDSTSAATGSTVVIPIITFFASRFWGFRQQDLKFDSTTSKMTPSKLCKCSFED